MGKLIGVVVTVVIILLIFALMRRGWTSRRGRQDDIPAPAGVPAAPGEPGTSAEGTYVCTTRAGDWLDRIAVHDLGIRTGAAVEVYAGGIAVRRDGQPDFYIPRSDLRSVSTADGMAGKFVEAGGLVVIGWTLGHTDVDTGFRTRYAADKTTLIESISQLEAS
ncbi:PH-like domain-containing protein [Spelaeicoccus albus]|uniref:PH domain-containing protein n=1 Tax=Spelaeicoccus albus TaxID=1280376 RepID=A0A7Z0D4A1_9MICO|nr:hypothetical protein [Spelaeicoccus albus]NYI68607.1 hypothetical protein [Spelaeicoccus albus]